MREKIALICILSAVTALSGCYKPNRYRDMQKSYEADAMYSAEMETRNTEGYQHRMENNQRSMEIRNQSMRYNDGVYIVK